MLIDIDILQKVIIAQRREWKLQCLDAFYYVNFTASRNGQKLNTTIYSRGSKTAG